MPTLAAIFDLKQALKTLNSCDNEYDKEKDAETYDRGDERHASVNASVEHGPLEPRAHINARHVHGNSGRGDRHSDGAS